MTIQSLKILLDARLLSCETLLNREVTSIFASDMMSDVLAHAKEDSVLITSLCNPQVVRTAEMLDITCVIFVSNKTPTEAMIVLAKEKHIALLITSQYMFHTCGILYEHGLVGGI